LTLLLLGVVDEMEINQCRLLCSPAPPPHRTPGTTHTHHPPPSADVDVDVWVSLGNPRITSTSKSGGKAAAGSTFSVRGVCHQNKLSNGKRGDKVG